MADKATLEIKIQDGGGSASNYQGPIQQGGYAQPASQSAYGPFQSVVQQPGQIQTAIDALIASIGLNNDAIADDPRLQKIYQQRAGELQGQVSRFTDQADERQYQETFGRPSDKEMDRRRKQQEEEEQDAHLDWMQILKQQNEQTQSLIRNTTSLTRQFDGLAGSIAALDIRGFSRQLTFATSQIPYVGEYLGLFTMALTGAINGINDTADRFSRFSPDLAVTDATIQAQRILRDIENAQRLGPQLAGFRQRQEEVRQRAEDLLLEILPRIIPLVERGLDYAETIVAIMEQVFDGITSIQEFLDQFNINLFGTNYSGSQFAGLAIGGPLIGMLELLTRIRENTEPARERNRNPIQFLEDLFQGVQMPPNPAVVGVQNGPANIPGAQGQLPPIP